jgi:hypothetical protein
VDFKQLLLADRDVTQVLTPAEIERAFDLGEQLKHVDYVFDRVFQTVQRGSSGESLRTTAPGRSVVVARE